jgi:hypothetical protein
MVPMCQLLQKGIEFDFNNACKNAFDRLKNLFTSTPISQPPNWDLPFEIMYDAGNIVVRAVLGQNMDRDHHVIYYISKTLDSA